MQRKGLGAALGKSDLGFAAGEVLYFVIKEPQPVFPLPLLRLPQQHHHQANAQPVGDQDRRQVNRGYGVVEKVRHAIPSL